MSRRALAALVVVAGALVLVIAATPTAPGRKLRRIANVHAGRDHLNTPDPQWTARVDAHAFRRAARLIPPGARYAVYAPTSSKQLVQHDLPGAGLVFLPRAYQVRSLVDAGWAIAYGTGGALPQPAADWVEVAALGRHALLARRR